MKSTSQRETQFFAITKERRIPSFCHHRYNWYRPPSTRRRDFEETSYIFTSQIPMFTSTSLSKKGSRETKTLWLGGIFHVHLENFYIHLESHQRWQWNQYKTGSETSERGQQRVYTPRNDKENIHIDLEDDYVRTYEATCCEPPDSLVSTSFVEANHDDDNNGVNDGDGVGATWSKPPGGLDIISSTDTEPMESQVIPLDLDPGLFNARLMNLWDKKSRHKHPLDGEVPSTSRELGLTDSAAMIYIPGTIDINTD